MTPAPITPPPPQILPPPSVWIVPPAALPRLVPVHRHYAAHAAILSRMGRMTPIEGKRCE